MTPSEFVVISDLGEYTHYARGCRMETDQAENERAVLKSEKAVSDHIAKLVSKWSNYQNQSHLVFFNWQGFAEYGASATSSYGSSWKDYPQGVITVFPYWTDYDAENWDEQEREVDYAHHLRQRLFSSVVAKVAILKQAAEDKSNEEKAEAARAKQEKERLTRLAQFELLRKEFG